MTTSLKNTDDNCFYLPQGIKNIDYQLINKTYLNYKEIVHFLQNYKEFEKESKHFLNIVMTKIKNDLQNDSPNLSQNDSPNLSQNDSPNVSNIQILESPENNNEYNRLVPPYNTQCYNFDKGCTKMAAFKSTKSNNCYCWFHINCQNTDN
jgi:hypothetical protein